MSSEGIVLSPERIQVDNSLEALNNLFMARGWGDGLPLVPPTEERVLAMLAGSDYRPEDVVMEMPPRWAEATVEKIAINAVMAACRPDYLPVLIAALKAMSQEQFSLYSVQATTHTAGPMVILNGPLRHDLGVNCRGGCIGPGWRANATIGRAIRLILLNVGGARPQRLDKSTFGHPAKYSFVLGENEEESPWEPLHVERGYPPETSVVTVFPAEGPHNIIDHDSQSAHSLLTTVAGTMNPLGCNNQNWDGDMVLVLGPEHAATIARDGLSKRQVKEELFQRARRPLANWPPELQRRFIEMYPEMYAGKQPATTMVPVIRRPERLLVVVAGGAGKHSLIVPGFALAQSAVAPVLKRDGEPLLSRKRHVGRAPDG